MVAGEAETTAPTATHLAEDRASEIRQGGLDMSNRVIVTDGGRGFGDDWSYYIGPGGNGGYLNGSSGGTGSIGSNSAGDRGSQPAWGRGAAGFNSFCNATAGSLGQGGRGASTQFQYGGGGGGGYCGGGGGACEPHNTGGGGSSYAGPSATNVVYGLGNQTLHAGAQWWNGFHSLSVGTHHSPPTTVISTTR